MNSRRPNLLEAFQASGGAKGPAPAPTPVSPAPVERPATTLLEPAGTKPRARGGLVPLVATAIAAIAAGVWIGRWTSSRRDGVRAESPDPASTAPVEAQASLTGSGAQPQAPLAAAPGVEIDATPRSEVERQLADPANVYTIKLVEYVNNEAQQRLALDALEHLTKTQGLPACVAAKGSRLFILVGAGKSQSELDPLLALCKQMAGPPPISKSAEFHDAYLVKIDSVFRRNP
jgi:hypothetical protein